MTQSGTSPSSRPSAWAFKNFRFYTYAGVLLPFAAQTQSLMIGWQIYQIKRDPLYLGLIGLTEALPAISLALISGYIVDRSNPFTVFKNVVRLASFSALLLFLGTGPWSPLLESQKVVLIYFAAFLAGVGRGFRMPAVTALVPRLVPREALSISSAWNTAAFNVASAMGPALGGFLYAWKGPSLPYGINFALLIAALVFYTQIQIEVPRPHHVSHQSPWHGVTAGLRFVFSNEILVAALAMDMFAVLFGGAVALLPIFAAEILKVGSSGLGLLRASASLGAMVGSLTLIRFPAHKKSGVVLLGSVVGFGLCMIGFGMSKTFWLSASLLAIGGFFDAISMVIRGAVVQLIAPSEMRGRIGAVNSVFIGVSNQLGEFESGVAAKFLGTAPSVIFGGLVTLLVVAITAFKAPKLRKMELHHL